MDELNKKLAEWAGIKHEEYSFHGMPVVLGEEIPDFTQSLDACFKWLFNPALVRICHVFKVDFNSAIKTLFDWWREELLKQPSHPALALCKAIERLIDNE